MKRIIVIGCPGSGKSYFSRALAEKIGIPLYHLDLIWWKEDGTNIERTELDKRLDVILEQDEWIIDGNYKRTMERRMQACDTVFFLDFLTEDCLLGVRERTGIPRADMAWRGAGDILDPEFVELIKSYNTVHRPYVLGLLEKYGEKETIIFHDRIEVNNYLANGLTHLAQRKSK